MEFPIKIEHLLASDSKTGKKFITTIDFNSTVTFRVVSAKPELTSTSFAIAWDYYKTLLFVNSS